MVYFRSVYNNLYALTVCSRCQITPLTDLNHSVDVIQNNNSNNNNNNNNINNNNNNKSLLQ